MARKSPSAQPIRKFFGKYANDIFEADARDERRKNRTLADLARPQADLAKPSLGTSMSWDEVQQCWPFCLLRTAAAQNDAEGYKRLLHYFLVRLGATPPKGVLLPFRWTVGRPQETDLIHAAWVAKGKPSLDWRMLDGLARVFYPEKFAKAMSDGKLRKNLRDRVRNAILRRHPDLAATKS